MKGLWPSQTPPREGLNNAVLLLRIKPCVVKEKNLCYAKFKNFVYIRNNYPHSLCIDRPNGSGVPRPLCAVYEIGRTEAIRSLGYTYKDIETIGIIMPVIDIHSKFLRPAKYDDLIVVRTTLKDMPQHHRIIFHSEIYNEQNKLLNVGVVTLYFMEAKTMKRVDMPEILKERIGKYFFDIVCPDDQCSMLNRHT